MITGEIESLTKKSRLYYKPVLSQKDAKKSTNIKSVRNKNTQNNTP